MVTIFIYSANYKDIEDKINDLNYGTSVRYVFRKEYKYKGIIVYSNKEQSPALPEEEIALLKNLGKIKDSFTESSSSVSILCERS